MKAKVSLVILSISLMSFYFFSQGPLHQHQSYHAFADARPLVGIPNAMDVVTNVFFLFVGFLGLGTVLGGEKFETTKSWCWFFLSIALIGPGSCYYHWNPTDETLVWDRIPMSMGFMAMYVALISEHIHPKAQNYLIHAMAIGIGSVLVWVMTSDLRLYYVIQFGTFVSIPLILVLFRSQYTKKSYYFLALVFYGMAKFTETKDREIFELTRGLISGHSLKHMLAATGLLLLVKMLRTRRSRSSV